MMGTKQRIFAPQINVSLEELVPQDHFYRHLAQKLDLSFVREFVKQTYADGGRPSIDPIVFFKLQLVMFFEGIRSERQLMRQAADRLSVHWYLGYDLGEPLPDHSSLSKIRLRYGLDIFRRFFDAIVQQCQQAKLIWGKELYLDSTQVNANAAMDSLVTRFAVEAREAIQAHLAALFADANPSEEPQEAAKEEEPSPTPLPVLLSEAERGDTKYGAIENIKAIEDAHIRAYIPLPDWEHMTPFYGPSKFRYAAEHDCYLCPQGQPLVPFRREYSAQKVEYRANAATCNACPLKAQCTPSDSGRQVHRSFFADILERVKGYQQTQAYQKALNKRKVWVEPLFAEAKDWHGMRRFRLRRLWRVNGEALITASGQNLKRLLRKRGWGRRPFPAEAVAMASPDWELDEFPRHDLLKS
jgi:transposase